MTEPAARWSRLVSFAAFLTEVSSDFPTFPAIDASRKSLCFFEGDGRNAFNPVCLYISTTVLLSVAVTLDKLLFAFTGRG